MDKKCSTSFVYFSRKLNFIDAAGKAEAEASKIRLSTALNYYASLQLGTENLNSLGILDEGYKAYSAIVDDPKGLSNYSDQIMKLMPNNITGNQKNWKSALTVDKVCSLLTPLPCSETKTDDWEKLKCSNTKPSDYDVKTFCEARTNFKKTTPVMDLCSIKSQLPNSFESNPDSFSHEIPKTQIAERGVKRRLDSTYNVNKISNKSVPNFSRQASCLTPTEPPRQSSPTVPPGRLFGQVNKLTVPDVSKRQDIASFKTANDELRLQNLKKHGKEVGQYGYGAVKRSLGGRRGGGVHGKFTPPILRDDRDDGKSVLNEAETEVDERLKNIDPKMIELIRNEIMNCGPKLTWEDIAGLEFAKNTIQEIVVWPMLRPDIFTGLRRPPKGILLFGPPGTGKTLIGKCIACQSGASFFSISASSLTSKWVGDGEKMVRALFAVARVDQPSVVFIDEIDSLLSQRSDTEHESSRRIKTEFLVQLDGVGSGEEDRILIIGATNRPQELDEAARRRLVKRLYIPLPDINARVQMVKNLIANERHALSESDIKEIAELTEGYSGADVKHVCQEASLGPIRSIPPAQISAITSSQVRPVDMSDFKYALTRVKSTVSAKDLDSYLSWDKQFGCGSL